MVMRNVRTGVLAATGSILLAAILSIVLTGCGTSQRLDNQRASKTVAYAPGVPNFDMEAVATAKEGNTGVDVHLGVPYFSFVFEPDSSGYGAPYEITVQVLSPDGETLRHQETWQDTLHVSDQSQTENFSPLPITRHLAAAPGNYVIRTLLRDVNSDRQAARLQRIEIPNMAGATASLGPLRMESRERGSDFAPVVTLHIPSGLDSLRASADLYNAQSADRAEMTVSVVGYETDNSVADPPYWLTPMSSSLEYRGVNYGESDTLIVERRSLSNLSDHEVLHYQLPDLDAGVYRVLMDVHMSGLDDTTGTVTRRQTRDLSVKGPEFPQVVSLNEVVEALTYIARESEIERIRDATSSDSMRRRFDAFWGERVESKQAAANLLETYYGRVEEANLYFTTHKAGWKTDRGMLYIILGAPIEIDYYVDSEVWYYSYSAQDPRRVYVFERGLRYDKRGMLFDNFVLQRRPYYQDVWRRVISRWRRGEPVM